MSTATTSPPTAVEMSKTLVDAIAGAVESGGDAATARAKLAAAMRGGPSAMAAAGATSVIPEPTVEPFTEDQILRPNGEAYWTRKLGAHQDVRAMRQAREAGINALAYGPPGTGKTAMFEAAFASESGGMWTIGGSGDTTTDDFIGGYVQMPDGSYMWVDGPLLLAMEAGGVLFVDEIALINSKVLPVLYSVMDGRGEIRVTQNPERGVVKAKPGFYVAGACNPNAPGAQMSEALISRFPLQLLVTTDYNLAKRLGTPAKMVTAAQNLEMKRKKGELGWSPQLRELLAFRDVAKLLGEDIALRNLVSGAPEIDRGSVSDIISRSYSRQVAELSVD